MITAGGIGEQATSRMVRAGGVLLHYNEVGSGPPLIFCEGAGPGTSAWAVYHRVLDRLSQDFRCLLLDQPGYGKSEALAVKGESRSTMYARTVHHFMDGLGIDKATIVDMSFYAQTAQVFAIDNPARVEKLVLHASGMFGPTLFAHMPSEAFVAMGEAFANPTLETMRRMMHTFLYNGASYSDSDLLLEQRLAAWLGRPDQREARQASDNIQRDLSAQLSAITAPVLQIHGRDDLIAPVEGALRLFNYLPDSRLVLLKRCGHWIPVEQPQEFCRLVLDFIHKAGKQ